MIQAAYANVGESEIDAWVKQFDRDGFLFLPDFLAPETVRQLKADLEGALAEHPGNSSGAIELHPRMFERSEANLRLFDLEPIVTFAEALV